MKFTKENHSGPPGLVFLHADFVIHNKNKKVPWPIQTQIQLSPVSLKVYYPLFNHTLFSQVQFSKQHDWRSSLILLLVLKDKAKHIEIFKSLFDYLLTQIRQYQTRSGQEPWVGRSHGKDTQRTFGRKGRFHWPQQKPNQLSVIRCP